MIAMSAMADDDTEAGATREASDTETTATVATRRAARLSVELPTLDSGETLYAA